MKAEDFRSMIREVCEDLVTLNETKGREYAGEDDALAFFREQAVELGLSLEQGWAVLARKHWRSLTTYVKEQDAPLSEPIENRAKDLILYCLLFMAMHREAVTALVDKRLADRHEALADRREASDDPVPVDVFWPRGIAAGEQIRVLEGQFKGKVGRYRGVIPAMNAHDSKGHHLVCLDDDEPDVLVAVMGIERADREDRRERELRVVREPRETPDEFILFTRYVRLGPDRTIFRLADVSPVGIGELEHLRGQFDWDARAAAADAARAIRDGD